MDKPTKQDNRVWIELEISDNDEVNHQRASLLTEWLFTKEEQEMGLKISYTPPSEKLRGHYNGHPNHMQHSAWADNGYWFPLEALVDSKS